MRGPGVRRLLPLLVAVLSFGFPPALAGQSARIQAEVFRSIDENRDAHLDSLRRLIQAQDEGEAAVQGVVAARLGELGLEVETLRLTPMQLSPDLELAAEETIDMTERISVVGRLPGTGSGRSLLFFGHPDGEPMTEASLSGAGARSLRRGDRGRPHLRMGSGRRLGRCGHHGEAVAAVLETAGTPRGELLLASTPAKRNARGILGLLNEGLHADASVYLHPAESEEGLEDIKAITSGMLQLRIVVEGRHPEYPGARADGLCPPGGQRHRQGCSFVGRPRDAGWGEGRAGHSSRPGCRRGPVHESPGQPHLLR